MLDYKVHVTNKIQVRRAKVGQARNAIKSTLKCMTEKNKYLQALLAYNCRIDFVQALTMTSQKRCRLKVSLAHNLFD